MLEFRVGSLHWMGEEIKEIPKKKRDAQIKTIWYLPDSKHFEIEYDNEAVAQFGGFPYSILRY